MFNIPTLQEIFNQISAKIKQNLPTLNILNKNSFIGGLVWGISAVMQDIYRFIYNMLMQILPNNANGEFINAWGNNFGVSRNIATQSIGVVVAQGVAGSIIVSGTTLQSANQQTYTTTADGVITAHALACSISRAGTVATITANGHSLATGLEIEIASGGLYNGNHIVEVVDENTLKIVVTTAYPDTTTATLIYNTIEIPVKSVGFGQIQNQSSGAILSLVAAITGLNTNLYVNINQLAGGTDIESDLDYRARIVENIQNKGYNFNEAQIIQTAKEVAGVTRVKVYSATPSAGQCSVYFVRDNDTDNIPTTQEVVAVKTKLLTIKSPTMSSDDLIVSAPTAVLVDFLFTSISPNTTAMQTAINDNLTNYFKTESDFGKNVSLSSIYATIYNTIDASGNTLDSFALSSPSADININDNQIAKLGVVNYA